MPRLDEDVFSPEFSEFVAQCLRKDPDERSSAMTLLSDPWLEMHRVYDMDSAIAIVREWLDKEGFVPSAVGK